MIRISNVFTGEVFEYDIKNQTELVQAWREATEMERCAKELKDAFKKLLPSYLDESGKSEEVGGYRFSTSFVTRKQYDKATLRRLIEDEDFFDTLMIPDKSLIDKLLKGDTRKGIDPDPRLWDISTELRSSMVDGKSWQITKLEKLS